MPIYINTLTHNQFKVHFIGFYLFPFCYVNIFFSSPVPPNGLQPVPPHNPSQPLALEPGLKGI